MATNNFLLFCPTDTGTNLLTQGDYAAAADRTSGNQPGIASSRLVNKAARQASTIAATVAQVMSDLTGADCIDNGTNASLIGMLTALMTPIAPVFTEYKSGSGTHNKSYVFFISSGSATAGATYTNNGVTYTVAATVASATQVRMTGNGAPTVSGTLTKASGTGDSALTFYAVRAPIFFDVIVSAGGGGGCGAGSSNPDNATAGSNSTFGTSLLTANGGARAAAGSGGAGAGGSATINSPAFGTAVSGGSGGGYGTQNNASAGAFGTGGMGGSNPLGGAGGGQTNSAGTAAAANTGGGGGGGGQNAGGGSGIGGGNGGGAGGYIHATIPNPSSSYSYTVGAGGSGGSAGTSGSAGSSGAAGYIAVLELFQ